MTLTAQESPIATRLRSATRVQHERAETSSFMQRLLDGQLQLSDYVHYLTQYAHVYAAIEARPSQPSDPAVLGHTGLWRCAAIDHDLTALGHGSWRDAAPLPATVAYVERIQAMAEADPIRFLAHHYTRYLGDLSGGQAIAAILARHYGATEDQLTFFRFPGLGPLPRYKQQYREVLNSLALSDQQIEALIDETQAAFGYNAAIFTELEAARAL